MNHFSIQYLYYTILSGSNISMLGFNSFVRYISDMSDIKYELKSTFSFRVLASWYNNTRHLESLPCLCIVIFTQFYRVFKSSIFPHFILAPSLYKLQAIFLKYRNMKITLVRIGHEKQVQMLPPQKSISLSRS